MASEQLTDSKLGLQLPVAVAVKQEPPSSPDDHRSPVVYSETVVTKEELILEDEYIIDDDADNEDDLEESYQPDSAGEGYRCKTCHKTFPQRKDLIKDKLIHYNDQFEQFIDVESLDSDGAIKCTKCRKPFKKLSAARMHFENHITLVKFRYECDVCYLGFGTKAVYDKHMSTHESKKAADPSLLIYQCNQCDKAYANRTSFKGHVRRHKYLQEGKYKCGPCAMKFSSKSELRRHELQIHKMLSSTICPDECGESPDLPLYCQKCDIQFDSNKAFSAHLNWIQTKDKRYQLPAVSDSEDSSSVAVQPEPMEAEDSSSNSYSTYRSSFQCKKCPEGFESKEDLQRHAKTHSIYVNKSGMLIMINDSEYKCAQCDKTFKNKLSASVHVRNHLYRLKGTYQCKICNLRCIAEHRLKIHMKLHEKTQKVSITKDHKRTSETAPEQPINKVQESGGVQQEPQTSAESSPFFEITVKEEPATIDDVSEAVPESDKPFVKSEPLEQEAGSSSFGFETVVKEEFIIEEIPEEQEESQLDHDLQPEDDEDGHLKCPQCDRKFPSQRSLTNHIRDHVNLKTERYKCDECRKCFPKKGNLDIHKKIHKKEYCHECKTCHEKFKNQMDLMKHLRVHVMDPKFVELLDNIPQDETGKWCCTMCESKFSNRISAYRHLRIHINKLEGTFKCKICNLRSGSKPNFKLHMQTHESWNELSKAPDKAGEPDDDLPNPDVICERGDAPLQCKTCDRFFLSKHDLHVHIQKSELRFLKLRLAAEKGINVKEIEQDKRNQSGIAKSEQR